MILLLLIGNLFALQGGTFTDDPRIQASVVDLVFTAIEPSDSTIYISSCSGTVVGDRQILTAAHCNIAKDSGILIFRQADVIPSSINTVADFVSHPSVAENKCKHKYVCSNKKGYSYDIAIVNLTDPLNLPAIPLYKGSLVTGSTEIVLAGFGSECADKNANPDGLLTSYAITLQRFTNHLMQTSTKDKKTCSGDSGGPVFVEVDGKLEIAAVTSHRSRLLLGKKKSQASRIIFNGSDASGTWIESILAASEKPETPPTERPTTASK